MMKKLMQSVFTAGMLASAPVLAQDSPQIVQGRALFAEHCALCHGADGRQGQGFQTPIWGAQTQISKFENALGLFEYNQMMMPFQDPTVLDDTQKLAIVAYILANHGAIPRTTEVTPATIAAIPIR